MAGERTTSPAQRRRNAPERAVTAYQRAADVHETAAAFYDVQGDLHRAQRHRDAASADLDEAGRERTAAACAPDDTESPLDKLSDIRGRVEQIEAETDSIADRVRRSVDAAQLARDRASAQEWVTRLRDDLAKALAEVAGLRTAMETRGVIEQTKGMIMAALKVDADTASRCSSAGRRRAIKSWST